MQVEGLMQQLEGYLAECSFGRVELNPQPAGPVVRQVGGLVGGWGGATRAGGVRDESATRTRRARRHVSARAQHDAVHTAGLLHEHPQWPNRLLYCRKRESAQ